MLSSLSLKFTENLEPVTIDASKITILVGANSSGKSLMLKEIEAAISNFRGEEYYKILKDFSIDKYNVETVRNIISRASRGLEQSGPPGQIKVAARTTNGKAEFYIHEGYLISLAEAEDQIWHSKKDLIASQLLRLTLSRLDGRSRFHLVNDQPAGDLLADPVDSFANIFSNDSIRETIREVIFDGIGLYFVIDPTHGGQLRIRLSSAAPTADEQSLNASARDFHRDANYILDSSDGFQAYTGIIMSIVEGDHSIVLIDEPEAFLHPPLAKKLGRQLTQIVRQRRANLIIATHSADFLIGCLQTTTNINVLRLEYRSSKSRGRLVSSSDLQVLYRHPLMRSANVISGLFYDGVVVTESDNDRVFYSEIFHRIAEYERISLTILFVNAQNKQTAREIVAPLRKFGVPAAAILDVDMVKDGGREWGNLLQAAQVPELSRQSNGNQREVHFLKNTLLCLCCSLLQQK